MPLAASLVTLVACALALALSGKVPADLRHLLIWPAPAIAFAFMWRVANPMQDRDGLSLTLRHKRSEARQSSRLETSVPLSVIWVGAGSAIGTAIWALIFFKSIGLAMIAGISCFAGPLLARHLLLRFADWKPVETSLDRLGRFTFISLFVAAPLSAAIGLLGSVFGLIPSSPNLNETILPVALSFAMGLWLAEALGYLVVTPIVLSLLNDEILNRDPIEPQQQITGKINRANSVQTNRLHVPALIFALCTALTSTALSIVGLEFLAYCTLFLIFPWFFFISLTQPTRILAVTGGLGALAFLAARAAHFRWPGQTQLSQLAGYTPLDGAVLVLFAVLTGYVLHALALDRKQAVKRVGLQAKEDMSTGLLNDRGLFKDLDEHLNVPDREPLGLIGVHLTNFDSLADLCGSLQAQQVERTVAQALKRHPQTLLAARISAGRYVLLLRSPSVVSVRAIAREIYAQTTNQFFRTENGHLRVQACVGGLTIDKAMAINSEECLAALSDTQAIASSVREPQLFVEPLSQTMIDARRSHQEQIEFVRDAIREGRLELFAQPIVNLAQARLEGPVPRHSFEILSRLRARDERLILPPEFIPLTVQAQMSVALDRLVVERTFQWLGANRSALDQTDKCSINLSGLTLCDSGIAAFIFAQRMLHNIPAQKIVFEITESEAIRNPSAASRLVDQLKAEGFGIALDDFGTGLATFEYLKRFAIDYLKIDGSFVKTLKADSIDEEIVRATIRVARHLKIVTVAEHVHQESVLSILRELGIDSIQGAIVGMPEPIDELFKRSAAVVQAPVVI